MDLIPGSYTSSGCARDGDMMVIDTLKFVSSPLVLWCQ